VTRHLLRLIWNRRGSNALLMAEIFFSFIVVFFVVGVALFCADNYRQPLGFTAAGVLRVSIESNAGGPDHTDAQAAQDARQLLLAAGDLPPVEAAALAFASPYDNATWSTDYDVDGRHYDYRLNGVSDGFASVMGLEVVRGRWFSREDDGAAVQPVVVNERLARTAFGDDDATGRLFPQDLDRDRHPRPPRRVVGVVRDFRQGGEFDPPGGYMFVRTDPAKSTEVPRLLVLRVRPGTTAAFEETLDHTLQQSARSWSFKVQSHEEVPAAANRQRKAPLVALGLVAGFLLLMVALGLSGVLWHNVTRRTREIGLRRAKGATARRIYAQIVGEVLVMTTLVLAAAVALAAQLPFLGLLHLVAPRVFVASLADSTAALYALVALCGLHPARLAARVQPAEALHYE
jgi:putative ABC transport system permease protein